MVNMEALHQQRVDDIKKTCEMEEPGRIPILGNVLTWAIGYAKGDTNYLLDHPEEVPEIWCKFLDEVYIDANFMYGLSTPIRALERLGSDAFFVSEDKHTIQHKEHCFMKEDDYDDLINDTMHFLIDTLGKRKFPALNGTEEEVYQALIDVALNVNEFSKANAACAALGKERYGIVNIFSGKHKVYPTFDVIFDRLRGFKGALTDIRRHREEMIEATDALYPLYSKLVKNPVDFPYGPCTLHCPTYLGVKNFEELFWPGMKSLLMEVYEKGSKTLLFLEGAWKPYYDIMRRDLPKGSVLCMIEDDDLYEVNQMIGDYFPIIGGVTTNKLKYGTKQECIDEAKKVIDECAPGGGFIFSTEKSLCTFGDVKLENLIAVNEYVRDNGKY